jgi:hypothetical protein
VKELIQGVDSPPDESAGEAGVRIARGEFGPSAISWPMIANLDWPLGCKKLSPRVIRIQHSGLAALNHHPTTAMEVAASRSGFRA